MAYFSNSTEGMAFDNECSTCKYGKDECPIALVQVLYNYDAANNELATKILNNLVTDDGKCSMKQIFKNDFEFNKNQTILDL